MTKNSPWLPSLLLCGFTILASTPALSQITPDNTLGAESSRLTPNVLINGAAADRIDAGATRGSNLFHSFSEFNIDDGQRVYFGNPDGIQNILTRVTGGNASNILGTLGVDGGANLFLLNPNGIIFGQNTSLDLRGSFVGTTANAIGFGDLGFFSATNPQAPPLLTVNPSALLFTQLNGGAIANQGTLTAQTGQSLVLAGGNIDFNKGLMGVREGRIELAAIAGTGTVRLNPDNSLSIPTDLPRADIALSNSRIGITGDNNSGVAIHARNLDISGNSRIISQVGLDVEAVDPHAGDISLDATGTVQIREGSLITNSVAFSESGKGGNINVTTGSLSLSDGATLTASTQGQGDSGNISLKVDDAISLTNSSSIRAAVEPGGVGTAGDIDIQARFLSVIGGSQIGSSLVRPLGNLPAAQGRGGNIRVNTSDSVAISGVGTTGFSSGLITNTAREATGNAGDITVNTGNFKVSDGAIVLAGTAGFGDGGKITINTNSFEALNGGTVLTNTEGSGKAGTVTLNAAQSVALSGSEPNFSDLLAQVEQRLRQPGEIDRLTDVVVNTAGASGIFASTAFGSTGDGGSIFIDPPVVTIRDGAEISVNSNGTGVAGNITLQASTLNLDNGTISAQTATSTGGNINLQLGDVLLLRRGSQIFTTGGTSSAGGDGSKISIDTPFIIALPNENSDISANAFTGRGGNVNINVQSIFGIQVRPFSTPQSDISASSEVGVFEADVQPKQKLVELPSSVLDASDQIAQVCPNGTTAGRPLGEFVVTGRGSLPPNPLEALAGTTSLSPLASLDRDLQANRPQQISSKPTTTDSPAAIVEAQGWVRTAQGKIALVASAPKATPVATTVQATCPVSK